MIGPETIDEEYITDILSDDDEARFKSKYEKEYNSISDDEAKDLVATDFRNNIRPKHEVLKAVKNAFHPDNKDGFRTEYEVGFTNPLYEVNENPADLVLLETNHRTVNLCFIVCEANGDECLSWPARVNQVVDVVVGHKDHLLEQLGHEDKSLGHLQYATAAPKTEIPDVDFQYLKQSAPDEYCLWSVDDDYEPDDDEDDAPTVLLKVEEGTVDHAKLRDPLEDGINYLDSKNTEISIALTTPPLISLKETLMTLLTAQHVNRRKEPREFDESDFIDTYQDLCEVGPSGDEKEKLLENEARSLLEFAEDAGIVYYGDSDSIHENRDYRARYSQGKTTEGLKDSITSKTISYRVPEKKAELAYDAVDRTFTPNDPIATKHSDWADN